MGSTPVGGKAGRAGLYSGPRGAGCHAREDQPISAPIPEILTESFCERCGTRYTFETGSPSTKRPTVAKARVLVRGLRNFVMSNDPLEAALADARRDDERGRIAAQMDAFHQTFNFCMDCRQYTCTSCWNEIDGRCLTCAPMPGRIEAVMAGLEEVTAPSEAVSNGAGREEAWPTADLAVVEVEPEVEAAAEPVALAVVEVEPEVEAAAEPVALAVAEFAWTMIAPEGTTHEPPPVWPPRSPVYQPPPPAALPSPVQAPLRPPAAAPAWPRPVAQALPPTPTVWEESSVSVINRPGSGVQACVSCGLPLSATARFCRRCGSRQD